MVYASRFVCYFCKLYILFILSVFSMNAVSLETSVRLVADESVSPHSLEQVTFGLPLSPGEVFDTARIAVAKEGVEQPVAVTEGLRWHWKDNSLRSVTIQLQNIDMTQGDVILVVSDKGRETKNDLTELDHSIGWTTASEAKLGLPHPRIFALHDPEYLSGTLLVPNYKAAPVVPDAFEIFQTKQFDQWAGALDYRSTIASHWLFDRPSAMFKAYMATGEVKFLKEAFLSKQFYFQHVQNAGITPSGPGGDGCWTFGTVACSDGKYIAPQSAKLSFALVGDRSQWDNELLVEMALQADLGWNQHPTRDPYDHEAEGFTERAAGLTGLAEIIVYEMTGDLSILAHLMERISSLKQMQQTEQEWDARYGWVPKSGAFTHSRNVHEGINNQSNAPTGNTNDRSFSPWMSENVADFLWHAYWITGHEDIPEMLRLLGHAIDRYGFASNYVSGSGISAVYERKEGIRGFNKCGGSDPAAVELMYFGSKYASADYLNVIHNSEGYTDEHNIEIIHPLALAYYFEPEEHKKVRLQSRIEKILAAWTDTAVRDCSKFAGKYRLFNWQHRSGSVRTWKWVKSQDHEAPDIGEFKRALTVRVEGQGQVSGEIACESTCTESFQKDSLVTLTAEPLYGYRFDGWTGSCSGRDICEVILSSNKEVVAVFRKLPEVSVLPVPRTDIEIPLVFLATAACEEGMTPHWQCQGRYNTAENTGEGVMIAVCPNGAASYGGCFSDHGFIAFENLMPEMGVLACPDTSRSGQGRLACNSSYIAATEVFDFSSEPLPMTYRLNVTITGNGSVTGPGINCGTDCEEEYPEGQLFSLNTVPEPGYKFERWSGDCDGADICELAADSDLTVHAVFSPVIQSIKRDIYFESRQSDLIGQCYSENSFGVHFGDLNFDGLPDLLTLSHNHNRQKIPAEGEHCAWINQSGSSLVHDEITSDSLSEVSGLTCTWTAQITDFNGDAKPDIWCRGSESKSDYYENTTPVTADSPTFKHTDGWLGEEQGDNAGGYKDEFLFADFNGDGNLQRINEDGIIRQIKDPNLKVVTGLVNPDWFDIDGDSYPDIWSSDSGKVLRNNGNGTFTEKKYSSDLSKCKYSNGIFHTDYDKDGNVDLLCLVYNENPESDLVLLRNEGNFVFSYVDTTGQHDLYEFNYRRVALTKGSVVVEDLNNDSFLDILSVSVGHRIRLLKQTSPGRFIAVDAQDFIDNPTRTYDWKMGSADYNGDGFLDFAVNTTDETQSNARLYENSARSGNNYIKVLLRGDNMGDGNNVNALGALIVATRPGSETIVNSRYIDVSSRRTGSNFSYHMGVGKNEIVDIKVIWPSGFEASQVFDNVPVNQHYRIEYVESGDDQISDYTPGSGW